MGRNSASTISSYELNRILSMAQTRTVVEIAAELGRSTDAVRVRLRKHKVRILRWCGHCETRHYEDKFPSPYTHYCRLHDQAEKQLKKKYVADAYERESRTWVIAANKLCRRWLATGKEPFRNRWALWYQGQ